MYKIITLNIFIGQFNNLGMLKLKKVKVYWNMCKWMFSLPLRTDKKEHVYSSTEYFYQFVSTVWIINELYDCWKAAMSRP